MRGRLRIGIPSLAIAAALGCAPDDPARTAGLGSPEVFTWGGQPISFSPPPEGWERQRSQPGGREGIEFIKVGSVGEVIGVEEAFYLDHRDRCDRLQALIEDLDNLEPRDLARALQRARPYAQPPLNVGEAWNARAANVRLDRAQEALRDRDHGLAREEIRAAREQLSRIRYSLDEVVDRVMYTGEGLPPYVTVQVGEPTSGELAGVPAIAVSYDMQYGGRTYRGRQIYVVNNNRLFVMRYQGLEKNLPLFERVVETVSFPPGGCEH